MSPVKWDKSDLVDMIHTMVNLVYGRKEMPIVRIGNTGFGNHLFLDYPLQSGPGVIMVHESELGGIPALMINMSAKQEKKNKLLHKMAQRYGGMYLESEDSALFEEFEDPFENDAGFLLKQIQKGGSCYSPLNEKQNEQIDELIEQLQLLKKPEEDTSC
jgi:hypothetical protein